MEFKTRPFERRQNHGYLISTDFAVFSDKLSSPSNPKVNRHISDCTGPMPLLWLLKWISPCARTRSVDLFSRLFLTKRLRHPANYQQLCLPNEQVTMASSTACPASLPTELIFEITDRLELDAILALKLTQRRFNDILILNKRRWQAPRSRCTQRAIQVYLAPLSPEPSHRHCILCDVTYPVSMFMSSNSTACLPMSHVSVPHNVVKLPPRVCSWHVARFVSIVKAEAGGKNEWVSHGDKMCMHCGQIQGLVKCGCGCGSCSSWEITTYTRYVSNEKECRSFFFWRKSPELYEEGDGRLWVREAHRDTTQDMFVDLPVRSESA
jgi:hypothetical protein